MMVKRVGDLELDQDMTYQQREWKAERLGWAVGALIVLAAAIGLLGSGVASQSTAGDEGGALWAEYDRFVRRRDATEMLLHIDPALAREGMVTLQLDQEFLEKVVIEDIVPKPDQEQAMGDYIVYSFAVAETQQPLRVIFHFEPSDIGPFATALAVEGAAGVTVRQFVYP